ncbi:MAG: patatin-like phospholipase family protein [Nitrososphaerales archaeon]
MLDGTEAINTWVLSAAGYDIIYEFGIASRIQEKLKWSVNPDTMIVGTSAGAIIGLALALGWNLKELIDILLEKLNGSKLYEGSILSVLAIPFRGYAFSKDVRYTIIDTILSKVNLDLTFSDLPVALTVVATAMATGTPMLFNRDFSPTVKLKDAVLASSSIPFFFKPMNINKSSLVDPPAELPEKIICLDGYITSYFPVLLVPPERIKNMVGICITNPYTNHSSSMSFFNVLNHVNTYITDTARQTSVLSDSYKERTLIVPLSSTLSQYFQTLTRENMLAKVKAGQSDANRLFT